jgi:alkylhydroperoxidase family enzyme
MVNTWPSVNAWEIWSSTLLNPVLSGAFREAEATHANRNLCCLQCLASWICLTYQIDPKPINPLIKLEK